MACERGNEIEGGREGSEIEGVMEWERRVLICPCVRPGGAVDLAVGGGGERWGTTASLAGGVRREGSVEGPLAREERRCLTS